MTSSVEDIAKTIGKSFLVAVTIRLEKQKITANRSANYAERVYCSIFIERLYSYKMELDESIIEILCSFQMNQAMTRGTDQAAALMMVMIIDGKVLKNEYAHFSYVRVSL